LEDVAEARSGALTLESRVRSSPLGLDSVQLEGAAFFCIRFFFLCIRFFFLCIRFSFFYNRFSLDL
ncbi:hypothetical protein, partial [Paenibacillus sp. 598K]|uniref:hypothetical protein n=1 Tax=Paenibacillus sp. 598K TaxID=1117987 RepID=UPI001C875B8B